MHIGGFNYVSKWVESITCPNNEGKNTMTFFKKNFFFKFGTP